jgi:hypothetical protein
VDRYDLTSSLRSSFVSLDLASQLRHTDTSLAIKADASYKMPSIGSHKVNAFFASKELLIADNITITEIEI